MLCRGVYIAYLFHLCAKSLLSRESLIADCTGRHTGVERPFSSLMCYLSTELLLDSFFWAGVTNYVRTVRGFSFISLFLGNYASDNSSIEC